MGESPDSEQLQRQKRVDYAQNPGPQNQIGPSSDSKAVIEAVNTVVVPVEVVVECTSGLHDANANP